MTVHFRNNNIDSTSAPVNWLFQVYYQGVKTLAPVDEKNVPLVDPNELFGNLAEVIAVNDELACQFQNIRDHRGLVQSIGPSLLDWIPKVKIYQFKNNKTAFS